MTLTGNVDLLAAAVAAEFNGRAPSPAAIVEYATTPAGAYVGQQVYSTVHNSMMKWDGTRWRIVFDGEYTDMLNTQFPPATFTAFASGTETTASVAPAMVGGHPGVRVISTSTTTLSGGRYGVTQNSLMGVAGLAFRCVFVPLLLTNSTLRIGLHDSLTSSDVTDGAYLQVAGTTASFKTSLAAARSTHGTTATLVVDTWYTLHVWFDAADDARCLLLKDDGTVVLDLTLATNVPIGSLTTAGVNASNSGTSAVPLLGLDWFGIRHTVG